MLRGRHCSYVTVHRNETYLYFNDLRLNAERPVRRSPYTKIAKGRSGFSQMPVPAERAFASSFPRSKPPDRMHLNFQSASARLRFRAAARPTVDRYRIALRPRHFDKARDQLVKTLASRGRSSRGHTATRFAFLPFSASLAFLAATAALDAGVTPNYQIQTRFLAMIAIECILISTLAACLKPFCREIILAAFLIMCNAAENFFR